MDEQQAIRILKGGDLAGLDTLTQLYYFRAVKTAYLIVQDRAEAEDIVQSAFVHAYHRIDQLASESFGPWFMRSVINAAIKAAQKQKRQVSLSAETGVEALSFEDLLIDQQPSPEVMVEMDELSQEVWQALHRLPADQRAAVVLKYYLGMSEAEMTAELNQPLSTIKWRLYAARQRLKNMLRPYIFSSKSNLKQSAYSSRKQE